MVEAAGSVSVGLLLWYGGGEVLHGVIGIGTLVAFKEYLHRFFVPLRDFSQKYAVMQSAMASAERIFQLLDTPVDIQNPKNAVVPKPFRGEVVFDNVWFSYKAGDPVLKGVSFRIAPGERVARRRRHRLGQDDDHQAAQPLLRYPTGLDQSQRRRRARVGFARACAAISAWCCRMCFCFPATCAATCSWAIRRFRWNGSKRRRAHANADQFIRQLPDGYLAPGARARQQFFRRPTPALVAGAGAGFRPGNFGHGRGDFQRRHRNRSVDPRRSGKSHARPHLSVDRAPAVDHPQRRPDHRPASRRGARDGLARRADGKAAAFITACTSCNTSARS